MISTGLHQHQKPNDGSTVSGIPIHSCQYDIKWKDLAQKIIIHSTGAYIDTVFDFYTSQSGLFNCRKLHELGTASPNERSGLSPN